MINYNLQYVHCDVITQILNQELDKTIVHSHHIHKIITEKNVPNNKEEKRNE